MRWIRIAVAACCVTFLVDARAVPITISSSQSGLLASGASASVNRYSDFVIQDWQSQIVQFGKFDNSLGTLLSAELTLSSVTFHPTETLFLPDVSGLPIELPFGAIAQDTERELHGPFNLWAYYDARVSYRADYRLTVDPLNSNLFAPVAAEAAFASCARSEDLFGDIGNQNPYCLAGNDGSPLGDFSYSWGPLSGADLAQFIGTDLLQFDTRIDSDIFGHCDDDDVGDYCRLNLAMNWNWELALSYTYEPTVPDTGGGNGGGDPVPVPEPGTLSMLSIALFGLAATRRRRAASRA